MNYQEYLQSPTWQHFKRLALERAKYKCEKCGFKDQLDVHHLTYANLGKEKESDLRVLCRRCHKDAHYFAEYKEVAVFHQVTEEEYERAKAGCCSA